MTIEDILDIQILPRYLDILRWMTWVPDVDARAGLYQHPDHRDVLPEAGHHQHGQAELVDGVDLRSGNSEAVFSHLPPPSHITLGHSHTPNTDTDIGIVGDGVKVTDKIIF